MAACLIGIFTAIVAFLVDVAEATISDWKSGYCSTNPFRNRDDCCAAKFPPFNITDEYVFDCPQWIEWSQNYWAKFAIYVGSALVFSVIAGFVTMTTKANLPAVKHDEGDDDGGDLGYVFLH